MIIAGLGWVPASLNMLPVGLAFCLGEKRSSKLTTLTATLGVLNCEVVIAISA